MSFGLPNSCGNFDTSGLGQNPIVNHAFSDSGDDPSVTYNGNFSGQQTRGNFSYHPSFDPSCGANVTWTAAVLHDLTVVPVGSGKGSVESVPYGVYCGGGSTTCTAQLYGTVTLTAAPAYGSYFAGWSGAGCAGIAKCTVPLDADKSVRATFNAWKLQLTKHPPKRTHKRTATFAFKSTAPGSKVKCSLDGRARRCSSPKTYRHLSPGPHIFDLQASRPGTSYGPTASYSWTVLG